MNKIVLEPYPASKLPADLRGEISVGASVRVTVEEIARKPMSRDELRRSLDDARTRAKGVTIDDAVARVRHLRDEWDN